MTFNTIRASNVFSFEDLFFEFAPGIHNILGVNGSGKTSLFLILSLGLYNKTPKGNKVDDANNIVTGKSWEIEVHATKDNGDKLRVLNSRVTGDIKIWKNGKPIHGKSIPQNLKLIEQEFGAYDQFVTRCYQSSESTIDLIEDSKDSARKEFVDRCINSAELDALDGKLEAKRKELSGKTGRIELTRKTISTLQSALGSIEEVAPEVPTEHLQSRVSELESHIQSLREQAAVINSKLTEVNEQYKLALTHETNRDRIAVIESEINEIDLESDSESLTKELRKIREQITRTESELKTEQKELSSISLASSKGVCDRCGHGVDLDFYQESISKSTETVDRLTTQLKVARIQEGTLDSNLRSHQRVQTLTEELLKLKARPEAQLDVESLSDQKVELQRQRDKLDCEQLALYGILTTTKFELEQAVTFNQHQRALKELNRRVTAKNAEIEQQLSINTCQLVNLEETLDLIKLGRELIAGFKTVKMQRFLKQLNQTMSKYTRMLCGGQIKCAFFVDDEGKIQFSVIDPHKKLPWNNWSKGQQARVKLSVLFGTVELQESLGTESYNVMFLDEIFGPLDSDGREGLSEVLVYLKQQGKSVFTIAHTPIIHQVLYDSVIRMEFENGLSRIGGLE